MQTETNTNLSQTLELADKIIQYDNAAKKILANKEIIAHILKECVEEFKEMSVDYIVENCLPESVAVSKKAVHQDHPDKIEALNSEASSIKEQTIYYDIKFKACKPGESPITLIINLEIQKKDNPGYPLVSRGIYYCSRMISEQYGTTFTNNNYDQINKVYSIWIIPNPAQKRQDRILKYQIQERSSSEYAESKEHYDLLQVILLYLGNDNSKENILTMLQILFSKNIPLDSKKERLNKEFNLKIKETLESEVLDMCNLGEYVYEEGINIGKLEQARLTAINLSKSGFSIAEISRFTQIDEKTIEELLKPVAV